MLSGIDLARGRIRKTSKIIAMMIALTTGATALAGMGHADGNSFIAYLEDHGQYIWEQLKIPLINTGYLYCAELRSGAPIEAVKSKVNNVPDPDVYIEAAQHELCPDTLP